MTPDISIVMSVFNIEKYLGPTLESILLQDHDSFEVVIVDDHSTDRTKKMAECYAALDPRFRVLTNQGLKGTGGAKNTGMAHMRGKTCYFLDGDDLLYPGALKDLYGFMRQQGTPMVRGTGTAFCHQRWLSASASLHQQGAAKNQSKGYPTSGFWLHLYDSAFLKNNAIIFPEHLPIGQDGPFLCHAYSLVEAVPVIERNILIYRINHKRVTTSGPKAIAAINYFLLARGHFDRAGKHRFVAPYLETHFAHQWLERVHAALEDDRATALLFMEKCAELLHDMEEEVRPFLDRQLGDASEEFWQHCRTGNSQGMLAALEQSGRIQGHPSYMGIAREPRGAQWLWYVLSRRLANFLLNKESCNTLFYMDKLRKRSLSRLRAAGFS